VTGLSGHVALIWATGRLVPFRQAPTKRQEDSPAA